jgi:predicted RNA-binding protein
VKINGGKLILTSLFGAQKELNAKILEIDFTTSAMKLEMTGSR